MYTDVHAFYNDTYDVLMRHEAQNLILCGVTSSGKTSIVDSIQNISEEFYFVVANDLMVQMVGNKYLKEDYWKYESKAIFYMYHMAKLLSNMGENVLIHCEYVQFSFRFLYGWIQFIKKR